MIRYARALLILISLVSAGTMLSLALELQTGRTSSPDSRARATVRSYYAAMEAYLQTGDLQPVRHVLAPEFIDSGDPVGGKTAFEDYLQSMRETYPHLTVDVLNMHSSNSSVIAEIRITPGPTSVPDALAMLSGSDLQRTVLERFRVDGNKVVDYWSSWQGMAFWSGFVTETPQLLRNPHQQVAVAQIEIDPGAHRHVAIPGPAVVIVESGSISTRSDPRSSLFQESIGYAGPGGSAGDLVADKGDILMTRAWDTMVWSSGVDPVVLLAITVTPTPQQYWDHGAPAGKSVYEMAISDQTAVPLDDGIRMTPLLRTSFEHEYGSVQVRTGRVILLAGSSVAVEAPTETVKLVPHVGYDEAKAEWIAGEVRFLNQGSSRISASIILIEEGSPADEGMRT